MTLQIKSAKPAERAYKLADTGGLFVLVQPNGSKLWRYKFRLDGVEGLQALGAFPEVTLADARNANAESRKLVAKGVHPVQARRDERESRPGRNCTASRAALARCVQTGMPRRVRTFGQQRSCSATGRSRRT